MISGGFGPFDDGFGDDIGTFRDWFGVWVLFAAVTVLTWPFFFFAKAARLISRVANRILS